jgi:branched-chain amino acid transport system ATP-binding protein
MLAVDDLHISYGNIEAVRGVSFRIERGEIVTIIGANGSGKTTIINTISGVLRPRKGTIQFLGKNITKMPPHSIVRGALVQIPEGREILTTLNVQENLEMGAYYRKDKAQIKQDIEEIYRRFSVLGKRKRQPTGTLSGGEQQMLAIARGLMARPQLLMMDEPSLGLAPLVVENVYGIIRELKQEKITILLVEQNARKALLTSDRGYVLETGKIVLSDTARSLLSNDKVREAYLGSSKRVNPT